MTKHHILSQVVSLLHQQQWAAGTHLKAQTLANALGVSRSPVNEALAALQAAGLVQRLANRGYFLSAAIANVDAALAKLGAVNTGSQDAVTHAYFQVAEARLRGDLPDALSERELRSRFDLSAKQCKDLLNRMSAEGWLQKKAGYGWAFSPMLTTPDSLLQSYRLRLALEPAALREPNYRISAEAIAQCRQAELNLLKGDIDSVSVDALHERGVRFHETLVEASGNPFFIDSIRRVNRVRRLLSYRSMQNRERYQQHCQQHLELLDLLELGDNGQAAKSLEAHLQHTLSNLTKIRGLLG